MYVFGAVDMRGGCQLGGFLGCRVTVCDDALALRHVGVLPRGNARKEPGSDAEASEPGNFAELGSISSTRSAGVSDSAYFIESIELLPTFDLFLGACRGLHVFGRIPSGKTLIVLWFCRTYRPIG
jgi:hypothetical protein